MRTVVINLAVHSDSKPNLVGLIKGTDEWRLAFNALARWYRQYAPGVRERHNDCQRKVAMNRARANGVKPAKHLVPIENAPPKPKLEGKVGTQLRNDSIAARVRWNRRYVLGWKERVNKHDVEYVRRKRQADSTFKLYSFLRVSIGRALRLTDNTRQKRTLGYVGCSVEELRKHLESQFDSEMNWSNYGTLWEVDHIIPLASRLPVELTAHYTNLQPLRSEVNNAKDNRIIACHIHKIIAHRDVPDELLDVALAACSY